MTFGVIAGYIASVLVFATFSMKTLVPLRLVAIASNLFFIFYGALEGLVPILVLHLALLPLNCLRLWELKASEAELQTSLTADFSPEAIIPLMEERRFPAGSVLFKAGDPSEEVYVLGEGVVELPELSVWLGPGDLFGEIGLFAKDGRRTASAHVVKDSIIYALPRAALTKAMAEQPKLGILLLRLITDRLLENAGKSNGDPTDLSPRSPQNRSDESSDREERQVMQTAQKSKTRRFSRRFQVAFLGTVALLVGTLSFAPTAYWLFARDAAVTSWSNEATAPIRGAIASPLPIPGSLVPADGRVVEIVDEHADLGDVLRAQALVDQALARVDQQQGHVALVGSLLNAWNQRSQSYAEGFRQKLVVENRGHEAEIAFLERRLQLARAEVERTRSLSQRGYASTADEENRRQVVLDLEADLATKRRDLDRNRVQSALAETGVFLDLDGDNPGWAFASNDAMVLERERAEQSLRDARLALERARQELSASEQSFADQTSAIVRAPAGSMIWSRIAGEGAAVSTGTPIVSWIDCSHLLIDAPVSNLLAGLLSPGAKASVTIEGESRDREARALLVRGAAAKMDHDDLAAVASGHSPDSAQVILMLDQAADFSVCPVGRGASVSFYEVSFLDLAAAFLRL
ncbi:MAG: cyclic nucleotide-binding domain-containing protein [Pseudomonadota bacterium]